MRTRRPLVRIVALLMASMSLTGCIDEISAIFDIILFSESDDTEVRKTGEVLAELREEQEARDLVDRFLESGDRAHLDAALEIRPDDTELHGYNVALATLGGDPADIEATKRALAVAEGRRLSALVDPGDPPISASQLERNVLGEILVAQTRMLGGSLTRPWDPPAADAPPEMQQLYANYCATRGRIMDDFADDLAYIPTPPCP
ncbi:MAG: hypothetical protein HKN44_08170 [Ilumatobacter sp.]|nr:hypothetical protein [Ilumatobacter sp.]